MLSIFLCHVPFRLYLYHFTNFQNNSIRKVLLETQAETLSNLSKITQLNDDVRSQIWQSDCRNCIFNIQNIPSVLKETKYLQPFETKQNKTKLYTVICFHDWITSVLIFLNYSWEAVELPILFFFFACPLTASRSSRYLCFLFKKMKIYSQLKIAFTKIIARRR